MSRKERYAMRPKDDTLRYAYRAAAAKLQSEEKEVTIRSVADEMEIPFKTAQRYLYRNEDVAQEIGLEMEHVKHSEADYTSAIVSIPAGVRPTLRRIGAALGIGYSSVAKFLENHPELRRLHPRFVEPTGSEDIAATKARPWKDMYVSLWNVKAGRYTGEVVTRTQYLEYWAQGLLKHQQENSEKPEHLPTPEEVEEMF